jgi:hypothetical protein
MPFDRAAGLLKQSHVGLVPITEDWPPNIPNKVNDYLFLGLPIIFSIKGQVRTTFSENGLGLYYEAGNARSLANNIILLDSNRELLIEMMESTTAYFLHESDGDKIYRQYSSFLETLYENY